MTRQTAYKILGWFLYGTVCLCVIMFIKNATRVKQKQAFKPDTTIPAPREKSNFRKKLDELDYVRDVPPLETAQDLLSNQYYQLNTAKGVLDDRN